MMTGRLSVTQGHRMYIIDTGIVHYDAMSVCMRLSLKWEQSWSSLFAIDNIYPMD